jgi:hypothetical protein
MPRDEDALRLNATVPIKLISATYFAATLRELGQYEQARQLGEDTLTRSCRVLGHDHPHTLRSAHQLVVTLRETATQFLAGRKDLFRSQCLHIGRRSGNAEIRVIGTVGEVGAVQRSVGSSSASDSADQSWPSPAPTTPHQPLA